MRLGVDPQQLDAVAAAMDRGGATLDAVARALDAAGRDLAWHGPDADRFRHRWRAELRPAVVGAAAAVRSGATDARRQAAEQRRTSDAASVAALAMVGAGSGATAGSAPSGATPSSAGVPSAPVSIRLVTAELTASGAVVEVGASVRLRVEDLGDGRSRIVELDELAAGATAQADVRVGVSFGDGRVDRGSGAAAALGASAGVERSWLVPTGDVDEFILSRLVDPNGNSGRNVVGSALAAVPGAGLAASVLGLGDGYRAVIYERPEPERVGVVAGASGSVDADARTEIPDVAVTASAATGVVLGVSRSSVDGSVSMRMSTGLVASATAGRTGSDIDWTGTTTLVVDRSGTPLSLSTVATMADDRWVEQQHGVIDLTAPAVRSAARELVDAVGAAATDPTQVSERVAGALRDVIVAGAVHESTRTDRYAVVDPVSYGIELPVGSAVVASERLRLER